MQGPTSLGRGVHPRGSYGASAWPRLAREDQLGRSWWLDTTSADKSRQLRDGKLLGLRTDAQTNMSTGIYACMKATFFVFEHTSTCLPNFHYWFPRVGDEGGGHNTPRSESEKTQPSHIRNNESESGKTTIDRSAGCDLPICTRIPNCLVKTCRKTIDRSSTAHRPLIDRSSTTMKNHIDRYS